MVKRDIRNEPTFERARRFFELLYAPGEDRVVNAADAAPRPGAREIAFTGFIYDTLDGPPRSVICLADMDDGTMRRLTPAGCSDRLPVWSPDGAHLARLSD